MTMCPCDFPCYENDWTCESCETVKIKKQIKKRKNKKENNPKYIRMKQKDSIIELSNFEEKQNLDKFYSLLSSYFNETS